MKSLFVYFIGIKEGISYSGNIVIEKANGKIMTIEDIRILEKYICQEQDYETVVVSNFRRME